MVPNGTVCIMVPFGTNVILRRNRANGAMSSVPRPRRAPRAAESAQVSEPARSANVLLECVLDDGNRFRFGYRIGFLSNWFSGPVYSVIERRFGMRRPKFATLFCLSRIGPLSATDIVQLTGIPKNSLSRAIAELVTERRLLRAVDRADSRRAILSITAEGRRVVEQIEPLFEARQQVMISVLTPAEQRQLDRLLQKLVVRDDDWEQGY